MREIHRNKGMLVNQVKGELEEQVDKESGHPLSIPCLNEKSIWYYLIRKM